MSRTVRLFPLLRNARKEIRRDQKGRRGASRGAQIHPDLTRILARTKGYIKTGFPHTLPTFPSEDPDLAMIVGLWDRLADRIKSRLIQIVTENMPGED